MKISGTFRLARNAEVDAATAMLVGVCYETVLSALLPQGPKAVTSPDVDSVVSAVPGGIGPAK